MMAEGVVLSASAGEHATASHWWEPLLGGSHAPAGARLCGGQAVCVGGFL